MYVIHLKANASLQKLASPTVALATDANRIMESQVATGEFMYQAKSWGKPRRVIVQAKRQAGSLIADTMFIVTTMQARRSHVIETYVERGTMENFIKECKNDFRMDKVSHSQFIANANRMQIGVLAYNLMIALKQLVLPESFKKMQTGSLRMWLFKVATRKIKTSGYTIFKACSHYVHQEKWLEIFDSIRRLKVSIQ